MLSRGCKLAGEGKDQFRVRQERAREEQLSNNEGGFLSILASNKMFSLNNNFQMTTVKLSICNGDRVAGKPRMVTPLSRKRLPKFISQMKKEKKRLT